MSTRVGARPREPTFQLHIEGRCGRARAGVLTTPHGAVHTPAFMAVASRGAVPFTAPGQVQAAGTRMIVANSFHLSVRPGAQAIAELGGIHEFMRWDGPVLTDSGGYQAYSLPDRQVEEDGIRFRHLAGGPHALLTSERSIGIQNTLGADVIMALDECTPYPAGEPRAAAGVRRTVAWAERCAGAHARPREQALFAIVQGGVYPRLRERCAAALAALELPGYAIGGISVGEPRELGGRVAEHTASLLPDDRPRYLMGVGRPEDVLAAIGFGIDLFDCTLPTRCARRSVVFTAERRLRLLDRIHRSDGSPMDVTCDCSPCTRGFSRAYLHHLFATHESLARSLAAVHNIRFYQRLVEAARRAVLRGRFEELARSPAPLRPAAGPA